MSRRSCVVVVELFACSRAELVPGTVLWLGGNSEEALRNGRRLSPPVFLSRTCGASCSLLTYHQSRSLHSILTVFARVSPSDLPL